MSSVTRRLKRGLRYEMSAPLCDECMIESAAFHIVMPVAGVDARLCRTCRTLHLAREYGEPEYDPSDGSTKGVRG